MKERENGPYKSLSEFIRRTNPKNINKLQLEGLVKAGAFDELYKKKFFFESIYLIQINKNLWDEKNSLQNNLFQKVLKIVEFLISRKLKNGQIVKFY